jgi:hypothetical protein
MDFPAIARGGGAKAMDYRSSTVTGEGQAINVSKPELSNYFRLITPVTGTEYSGL